MRRQGTRRRWAALGLTAGLALAGCGDLLDSANERDRDTLGGEREPTRLEEEIAAIRADGGDALLIQPGESHTFTVTDPESPIVGAGVDIPNDALPLDAFNTLVVLKPAPATPAYASGQTEVGAAAQVQIVLFDNLQSVVLIRDVTIIMPYRTSDVSDDDIDRLAIAYTQGGATPVALTRGLNIDTEAGTVRARTDTMGTFAAMLDFGIGSDNDDENPTDATNFIRYRANEPGDGGQTCSKAVLLDAVHVDVAFTIADPVNDEGLFRVTVREGSTQVLRYEITTTTLLNPPSQPRDPGFPNGFSGFSFAINCASGGDLVAGPTTWATDLATPELSDVVTVRELTISDWRQDSSEDGFCGTTCVKREGRARVQLDLHLDAAPAATSETLIADADVDVFTEVSWETRD